MMKRLLFSCAFLFLMYYASAAPIGLQRATVVAEAFLTAQDAVSGPQRLPVRSRLASSADPQAKYYVFENNTGGFVIVSGDDIAYPILGYSTEAAILASDIPDNVKVWLDQYAAEIQAAVDSGVVQSESVKRAWSNISSYSNAAVVVSPLILTRWNQSPYYNDQCPMDNSKNERTVTGCVATAMAQVLKYWEFPIKGNGSHAYSHTHGEQSADFANTTYDWKNMPLELTESSSNVEKASVAQLMYHCGVSVEMDYGVSATGGSGAFTISSKSNSTHCAEYALREYWGYKPTLQGLQKTKYTDKNWKAMLKEDLEAGRPIIYSGHGDGGHCFVCDGYDENEYFHFNWGWGGLYDGYFKLNALEPGTGGIGSGGGVYNDDQQAILGLEPLRSLDEGTNKNLQLASNISISSSEIAYKEGFSISASVKNSGTANFSGELGLALYDSGLELLTIMDAQTTTISTGSTIGYTFSCDGWSELVSGLYYAAIYSKTAGGDWIAISNGSARNMIQFRIKTDPCAGNKVYECDFESELLGWTFAKANGIKTGFAVGTATKYQGEKSLYVSPDGGTTVGYTQDNNKGYVSVAYKKLYLEAGIYGARWYYFTELKYLDVDNDYFKVYLVPSTNDIHALDSCITNPTFLNGSIMSNIYSSNYSSWTSSSPSITVTNGGNYYLVLAFIASNKIADKKGAAFDNLSIYKKEELKFQETLKGVQFDWTGGYAEYRITWYNNCDYKYKYDTITDNNYLIPYTMLREAVHGKSMFNFSVTPICENGQNGNSQSKSFSVHTEPFPLDTCPAVPIKIEAKNTDYGVQVAWKGNSGVYDFKYGTSTYGCSFIEELNSINDTNLLIDYDKFSKEGTHYFFVRGICDNDTSIWKSVSLNVQGPNACSSEVIHAKPCNFYAQNTADGIMLTWQGNASKYEIECRSEDEYYKRGNIYQYNDSNYVRFMSNEDVYTIPYNTLSDTLYHFRVRAICENDTSFWTDYISAYNINFGEYRIPFYDLCGPNTLCTYGSYSSPYSYKKTLDFRQKDWKYCYNKSSNGNRYGAYGTYPPFNNNYYRSRHTICFEGETDPHCDNQLTTVPPGEKYSMRLGNWYNGEGESVTFTHKIDSGYKLILLLKYAVVLQDPSHESKENPHFTLEILDENNQLLDPVCWYADFAADKNAEGWRNAVNAHEPDKEEFRNVVWKDWTTIGINLSELSQYGDRIIKIRLTTKDCTRGQHFGYAYFTLNCTTSEMKGMVCGERPIKFEVPEGFKYNWYLMDDTTKTSCGNSNVFVVQPTDTNSYHVDLISLENDECYYTMDAYTLPRLPRPQATFKHTPQDCINKVTIENTSYIYKIMLDGSEQRDGRIGIDSIIWDLGKYGTSTEVEPTIVVPNEGDTFKVSLRVVATNLCAMTEEYTLSIPAIKGTTTYTYRYICKGEILHFEGKDYSVPGQYVLNDSAKMVIGCDSVSYLVVEYLEDPQPINVHDTICTLMLPYDFYGQSCMTSGVYEHTLKAQGGCDSVVYRLNLYVYDELNVKLHPTPDICAGDPSFDLSYNVLKGSTTGYSIAFTEEAKAEGFMDIVGVTNDSNFLTIDLPQSVKPNTYAAEVSFENHGCEKVKLPLSIQVLYSSDVITQRWNDVLAVRQTAFDNYEGFSNYQWYCDGMPIEGATQTILYKPEGLQGNTYQVELTRLTDGLTILSCPFTPTMQPNTSTLAVSPTLVAPRNSVQVTAPESGMIKVVGHIGQAVNNMAVQQGENHITAPNLAGLYMIQLTTASGKKYVQKIIVY